jgi:hypothetical protein
MKTINEIRKGMKERFDICSKVFAGLPIIESHDYYVRTGSMEKLSEYDKKMLLEYLNNNN